MAAAAAEVVCADPDGPAIAAVVTLVPSITLAVCRQGASGLDLAYSQVVLGLGSLSLLFTALVALRISGSSMGVLYSQFFGGADPRLGPACGHHGSRRRGQA